MKRIFNDITELAGNTPLVMLNRVTQGLNAKIAAKLEFFNPLSSIKDRVGLAMINEAEKQGLINKDTVVIEPTSGNTGIALAYVCSVRGYRLIIVLPGDSTKERIKLLKFLGAEVVLSPPDKGMDGALNMAEKLSAEIDNSYIPNQFVNPSNPAVHEKTTAVEIWEDTRGEVDIVVCGVGTGGTLTGVGREIKGRKSSVKVVAVEPERSAVISGEKPGRHNIPGLGAGFIPRIMDRGLVDEVVQVSDQDAMSMTRRLAREEGILAGISSGAAAFAALKAGQKSENRGKLIVTILPDTGERYLSILEI